MGLEPISQLELQAIEGGRFNANNTLGEAAEGAAIGGAIGGVFGGAGAAIGGAIGAAVGAIISLF